MVAEPDVLVGGVAGVAFGSGFIGLNFGSGFGAGCTETIVVDGVAFAETDKASHSAIRCL